MTTTQRTWDAARSEYREQLRLCVAFSDVIDAVKVAGVPPPDEATSVTMTWNRPLSSTKRAAVLTMRNGDIHLVAYDSAGDVDDIWKTATPSNGLTIKLLREKIDSWKSKVRW